MGSAVTATSCTSKTVMRALIIEAMNEIRGLGNEPSFQSVSRWVEKSGRLTAGDFRENPSSAHDSYAYVYQMTLSFVASEMKQAGELIREFQTPWMLTSWGVTSVQLAEEIRKKTVVDARCDKCFCIHRTGVECW